MERNIKKSAEEFIDTLAKGHDEKRLRNTGALLMSIFLIGGGINLIIHSDTTTGITLISIGVLIASSILYDAYTTGKETK